MTEFTNNIGTWIMKNGYCISLVYGGRELVNDPVCVDERYFLNNPDSAGGLGNFGFTIPGERRSLSHPNIRIFDYQKEEGENHYTVTASFNPSVRLINHWLFEKNVTILDSWLQIRPGNLYIKEPEYAFSFWNPRIIRIGKKWIVPKPMSDPRKSTAHADNVGTKPLILTNDLEIKITHNELPEFCKDAKKWPKKGWQGCGWRTMKPSIEVPSWGMRGSTVLIKAWDGCVTSTDAPRFFRQPKTSKMYRFRVEIRRR